jgi:hypothetical protein
MEDNLESSALSLSAERNPHNKYSVKGHVVQFGRWFANTRRTKTMRGGIRTHVLVSQITDDRSGSFAT